MDEMPVIYKLKSPISHWDRFTIDQLIEKFLEPVNTQEYPKMVYHDENKPFTVNSKEEEDKAMSDGYRLEPGNYPKPEEPIAETNDSQDPPAVVIPEPTQYDADKTADEINADAS